MKLDNGIARLIKEAINNSIMQDDEKISSSEDISSLSTFLNNEVDIVGKNIDLPLVELAAN